MLHAKTPSVVHGQQHGTSPSLKCSPVPAAHPDGEVLRTKAWYSEGMSDFSSSHFRPQILVSLSADGKPVFEGHNQRLVKTQKNPSSHAVTLSFLQSKLSANTCQHLTAGDYKK